MGLCFRKITGSLGEDEVTVSRAEAELSAASWNDSPILQPQAAVFQGQRMTRPSPASYSQTAKQAASSEGDTSTRCMKECVCECVCTH